jgi:hypothetical protein
MRFPAVLTGLVLLAALPFRAWAACDCAGHPFKASRSVILSRDSSVLRGTLVNDDRGRLKVGGGAFMPATTNATAYTVTVGADASIGSVNATLVRFHPTSTVAGPVVGPLSVPVETPFCSIPALSCGGESLLVTLDQGGVTLSPGSYGSIKIAPAALVHLLPGSYQICDLRIAHSGAMITDGPVTIDVAGSLRAATTAVIVPAPNQPRPVFRIDGSKVVFGNNSFVRADVSAPSARLKIGRQSGFDGCFCASDAKLGQAATVGCTTGSPSGAFLD